MGDQTNLEIDLRLQKIREIQLEQIKIIKIFVKICEKENLTYYMIGGTMLGAIRHKGFIPWDDDADFGMPRSDYDKFLTVASKYLTNGVILETFSTNSQYPYYFSRVSSSEHKIFFGTGKKGRMENIWVDIFPLDGMPNKRIIRLFHKYYLLLCRALYQFSRFEEYVDFNKSNRIWYERFLIFLGNNLPIEKWLSKKKEWCRVDKALKKYPYEQYDYLINLMGGHKLKELFSKKVFGEGFIYDFEGMKLCGPSNYDFYLKQLYGDYMTFPPEAERNWHRTELIADSDT